MAKTFLFVVLCALLALVSASANPVYLVNIGRIPPAKFATAWRSASVEYAGRTCHHHVISVKLLGHGQAQVFSGMVPFNNARGCHPESGVAKVKPTDTTRYAARLAGVKIVKQLHKRDGAGEDLWVEKQ